MPRITTEASAPMYGQRSRKMENIGFGGVSFKKEMAAHQELEAQYILQLKADREADTAEFKAKLEAIDRAQPPRRYR